MTTDQIIELSKQAAEVLGVPAFYQPNVITRDIGRLATGKLWLAEDAGRCADIANDRLIDVYHDDYSVATNYRGRTMLSDHNNDRLTTWRVAVLKAVIEQGEQS